MRVFKKGTLFLEIQVLHLLFLMYMVRMENVWVVDKYMKWSDLKI